MWKFVTRGIRETLERRACRTNVYSQTSQDSNAKTEVNTNLTCNHKFLAPNFSIFNKESCGSAKANGAKDKDHESKWNTNYTWSDAVGWTSVLTIGWVVCQTLCLRKRIFEKEKNDSLKSNLSQFPETRIINLFNQVLNLRPKHILPITNCVGNSNQKYKQEDAEAEWKTDKPFGPITVEEALKEATEEFANAHKLAMGEFELHRGLKALEDKRYEDALKHFATGAKLSSTASMFNLGLCYELGLGTLADQSKAAEYYNNAAERDHPDAAYNLGVFHAQGRGGFSIDVDRARSYFTKAAKLGQSQAQYALDLEKEFNIVHLNEHESTAKYVQNRMKSESTTKCVQRKNVNHIFKKLINYNFALNTHLHEQSLEDSDYNQIGIETKNPIETFLKLLGLNDTNILLIPAGSNCKCVVSVYNVGNN